jgi:Allene oxide cyclase barrel like domain
VSEASTVKDLVLENLREISHTTVCYQTKEGIGTHCSFYDEIFDAEGNQIGTAQGIAVVFADADSGELKQVVSATDHLADGTICWTGTYPMYPVTTDHEVLAVGTSGQYRGMIGKRYFQFQERPNEETSILRSRIVLSM